MTKELFLKIFYCQTALSALVAVLCFVRFKQRETYIKLIGFSFLLGFAVNALAVLMLHFQLGMYVNVPQSVFGIVSFCVTCLVYYEVLGRKHKTALVATITLFVLFSVFNLVFLQQMQINSYNNTVTSIVILVISTFYFYRLVIELPTTHLSQLPMFWVNTAILCFNAGTLVLFVFTSYLVNTLKSDMLSYWSLHNILSIAEHLVIMIGLYFDLKRSRPLNTN